MEIKKYIYIPYSDEYPVLFQKENDRLIASFDFESAIEHVGSTSVPGLGGKGIIDIAIAVPKDNLEHASQKLKSLGYEYRPKFSTDERHYFVTFKGNQTKQRFHVHLTFFSSKTWKELIEFRDYLRAHPDTAKEYAMIKKQAAESANQDGKLYRKIKEPFIEKIIKSSNF